MTDRMTRQKQDSDKAFERASRNMNAPDLAKGLSNRKNYLDELQKELEQAGQTPTERTVFNTTKETPTKQWWE